MEYPRKGIWAVGFATKENQGLIRSSVNEDIINVLYQQPQILQVDFINGTQKDLIYLDVTFEQASNLLFQLELLI